MTYAYRKARNAWPKEDVISRGDWGFGNCLAFNLAGEPAIAFLSDPDTDEVPSSLGYAVLKGAAWQQSFAGTLTFDNFLASVSLAFTAGGLPAMAYYDPATQTIGLAVRGPHVGP